MQEQKAIFSAGQSAAAWVPGHYCHLISLPNTSHWSQATVPPCEAVPLPQRNGHCLLPQPGKRWAENSLFAVLPVDELDYQTARPNGFSTCWQETLKA